MTSRYVHVVDATLRAPPIGSLKQSLARWMDENRAKVAHVRVRRGGHLTACRRCMMYDIRFPGVWDEPLTHLLGDKSYGS